MEQKIIEGILYVCGLIVWGLCIAIGFWMGHGITNRVDRGWNKWRGKRIAQSTINKVERELEF